MSNYWVKGFIAGNILLLGSSSTSIALTLANLPPQLESDDNIALKKPAQLKKQRQLFLQAEAALKKGHYTRYKKIEHRLNDYPLYPYLRFMELKRNIRNTSSQKIQNFLQSYHNTPLANKLYYRWVSSLAKSGKSEALIQYFRPTQNTRLLCHYANALHKTGKRALHFPLWESYGKQGVPYPKAVTPF